MIERVSVIVPNLDCPVVGDAVEAVLAQASGVGCEVEVIVVGRDAPAALRLVVDDSRVRFLETPSPVSPARARNIGASAACGQILAFLDADCVPDAGWLEGLVRVHEPSSSRTVYAGSVRIDAEDVWAFADNLASFHAYLPSRRAGELRFAPACNLSVPRGVWSDVGPFDERLELSEDLDWTLRARRAGITLRFEPSIRVWHRSQRTTSRAVIEKARRVGAFSALNRLRYAGLLPPAPLLSNRPFLLLASPFIAIAVASLAFVRYPRAWRRPRVFPVVVAAKLGWCRGAAFRPSGSCP